MNFKSLKGGLVIPLALATLAVGLTATSYAQSNDQRWRPATEKELKALIPARATVEKERIETEFRTASGVTDGNGKFVAGVVMITAGYAAEGKYSHFLIAHVALRIGDAELRPGEYVFGYRRTDQDTLEVKFYEAPTGRFLGTVTAHIDPKRAPIRSLTITPGLNGEKPLIRIGRFFFEYSIGG